LTFEEIKIFIVAVNYIVHFCVNNIFSLKKKQDYIFYCVNI
jgi:hypothetical protein